MEVCLPFSDKYTIIYNMEYSPKIMKELLEELSRWLDFEDCEPVELVVCGGTAMALQNLTNRTTRDVDVLGKRDINTMTIEYIDTFTDEVKGCLRRVVENHPELDGLGENWINLGPRDLLKQGLPEGFDNRLVTVRFGQKLTLHLLSRPDLLALKLYTAADDLKDRQEIHEQDIAGLNPSYEEIENAVEWIKTLPKFEEQRLTLKHVVEPM